LLPFGGFYFCPGYKHRIIEKQRQILQYRRKSQEATVTTKTGQSQEEVYRESLELASTAPGVIPFMESEVQRFEAESAQFQAGEQDNAVFTPFRLRQGVYGQRQADVQ
jgi:hypothetical protein